MTVAHRHRADIADTQAGYRWIRLHTEARGYLSRAEHWHEHIGMINDQ